LPCFLLLKPFNLNTGANGDSATLPYAFGSKFYIMAFGSLLERLLHCDSASAARLPEPSGAGGSKWFTE
jgi:hypothetical protein